MDLNERVKTRLNVSQAVINVAIVAMTIMLAGSIILGARSCSSSEYCFSSQSDAINCYRGYLSDIRRMESIDARQCSSEINKWFEVRDTVFRYLAKDSTFSSSSRAYADLENITDSIREELTRLAETWKCSFSDVIAIKESTSPFRTDEEILSAVHDATPFFLHLDSIQVPKVTKEDAITKYRVFLALWQRNGISTDSQMLKFISSEDIFFRTFLTHLYELEDDHISDITQMTEDICTRIFREARKGNINAKTALTYMSMRTVRRLLQNSTVCVNDLKHRKMKSEMQANAYLWMIIQPFMSIDKFAIATITPEGRQNFNYIAEQLPKSSNFSKAFNIDQRALNYLLPQQLLKMYIQTL